MRGIVPRSHSSRDPTARLDTERLAKGLNGGERKNDTCKLPGSAEESGNRYPMRIEVIKEKNPTENG